MRALRDGVFDCDLDCPRRGEPCGVLGYALLAHLAQQHIQIKGGKNVWQSCTQVSSSRLLHVYSCALEWCRTSDNTYILSRLQSHSGINSRGGAHSQEEDSSSIFASVGRRMSDPTTRDRRYLGAGYLSYLYAVQNGNFKNANFSAEKHERIRKTLDT